MKRITTIALFGLLVLVRTIAQAQTDPFITTWSVTTIPDTIKIGLNGSLTYDFDYVWKNAADSSVVTSGTHTSADGSFDTGLPVAGTYILEITGNFPHLTNYPKDRLLDVRQWGDIVWESFSNTFSNWSGQTFSATDAPILNATGVSFFRIFRQSSFRGDISHWDLSNVTGFNEAFQRAGSFNSNVANWNLTRVENFSNAFNGASNFQGRGLSQWDISNATRFGGTFSNTAISTATYDSILTNWANQNVIQRGVDLGANGVTFCESSAARDSLIIRNNWNINDGGQLCLDKKFISFTAGADIQVGEAVIDTINQTVNANVIFSADLSAIAPVFTLSTGATSVPASGEVQDFTQSETDPVIYEVTASDGTTQSWSVTIGKVATPNTGTSILSFSLHPESPGIEQVSSIDVDTAAHTVTINLEPFGSISEIIPEIGLSLGASSVPQSLDTVDVSSGLATISVTAEDGVTTQDWTVAINVLLSSEKEITSFTLPGQLGATIIDAVNHLITVPFAPSTNRSSLAPTIGLSQGASSAPFSGAVLDFTDTVSYVVTAQDGSTQEWRVIASVLRPFISQWSVTAGQELIIGLNNAFSYDFRYEWKNESGQIVKFGSHKSSQGNFTTTFQKSGQFKLEIIGDFPHFQNYPKDQLMDILQWGNMVWKSFRESFRNWTGTNFSATDIPDLSQGPDMFRAFSDNPNFNADLSQWDVSQLTTLQGLFNTCPSFDGDLSLWNVSNVTRMVNMFLNASNFDGDLSGWDVRKVTDMSDMLSNSGMSIQNYDKFLISMANQEVKNGVKLGAANLFHCLGTDAIAVLKNDFNWQITDAGEQCSSANDILTFDIPGFRIGDETIDTDAHTVSLTVINSADLTELTPVITISDEASISPASGIIQDFSLPVSYQVVSSDSTVQEWIVTVTNAADALTEANFLTFDPQNDQVEETIIDAENHTITLELIAGGTISAITPEFTLSTGATATPAKGESIDMSTNNAVYTVTAEDGVTTQEWTIDVIQNNNTDILNFELTGKSFIPQIDSENHTVNLILPEGADVTALLTNIQISAGASINPGTIAVRDFTNPVSYTVTAEDGISTQEWVVSVQFKRPFITKWKPQPDDEESFIFIGFNENFDYQFSYQWKDADGQIYETGPLSSTDEGLGTSFPNTEEFTLEIIGDFPHFTGYTTFSLLDVVQWGDIAWKSFAGSFKDWTGTGFSAADTPNLSQVNDMSSAFEEAASFNGDLSQWNVSNVTNMSRMFLEADAFNGDVSSWVTNNVTDMGFLFAGADSFNGDVSNWEVGNVTTMNHMFNLAQAFNRDLSGWDVKNVTDMFRMFRNTAFDQDISTWNISSVSDMREMFDGSALSTQLYDRILIGWSAQAVQEGVTLGATGIGHCFGASAVASLTNDHGWTVNDDGPVCSSENDILNFDISEFQLDDEVIDTVAHTVNLTVISSADLSALTPTITLSSGATFAIGSPASGEATDFTSAVEYEVLSTDSTFQTWTVTVTNSPELLAGTDILNFLPGAGSNLSIDTAAHEVTFDAVITATLLVTPEITLSLGATISPASGVEIDLSDGTETYLVTAEDGTAQEWTVIVNDPAPVNDLCSNAIQVNVGDTFVASSAFATSDAGTTPACGTNRDIGLGVWYKITGNGESITINTCGGGTGFDTSLSLYTGSCESGLICLVGNDDNCGLRSKVKFNSVEDEEYLILVDGFSSTSAGQFELAITSEPALDLPANDDCTTAELLTVFAQGVGTPVNGNNTNATFFPGLVSCDNFGAINDVWYTFNSGPNVQVEVRLNGVDTDSVGPLNAASGFRLAAYTECGGNSIICDTNADGLTTLDVTPNTEYRLQVWNDDLEDEGTFTIIVNDGPNTAANLSFKKALGNELIISRFAAINAVIDTLAVNDPQGHAQIRSLISGNEEGIFTFNSTTGAITLVDTAALRASATTSFELTFQAVDQGPGELTSEITLTINITDNAAPVVNEVILVIDENTAPGTVIGTLEFSDSDGDFVSIVGFTSPSGLFSVNPLNGEIMVVDGAVLDFETANSFTLEVEIEDDALASLQASGTITINLNDINEAPVAGDTSFTISQFNTNGASVGLVTFEDQDIDQNHTYVITGGNADGIFTIDAPSGEITVANETTLNTNGATTYNLQVEVSDDGSPVLSDISQVAIHVVVNNPPVISTSTFSVPEKSANSTLVGTIAASDSDGDEITFSILSQEVAGMFLLTVDGQLFVQNGSELDFETNPSFDLQVSAKDSGPGQLQASKTITVQLSDVNEAPGLESRNFGIASSVTNGTIVGVIQGEDPENDLLSYAIVSGNGDGVFTIDPVTGALAVQNASPIDPGVTPGYTLIVAVSDGEFSDEAQISIDIFLNGDSPVFTSADSFEINENNEQEALIGTLVAEDADGISGYSIVSGNENELFTIDQNSGELRVSEGISFNFEETRQYLLEVSAADAGLGTVQTTQQVTINITDVNEFDPVVTNVSVNEVDEQSSVGTEVAQITTTDEDIFQSLTYAITAGNTGGAFAIDSDGLITVNNPLALDFETTPTFNLTVEVSDDVSPIRTAASEVVIELHEVQEASTATDIITFVLADQTGAAVINTTAHTVAVEVALGTDMTALSPALTLSEGATSDPASGAAVDFTSPVTYTVTAEDGTTIQDWTVTVTLDSELPDTDTDILTFSLSEQTSAAVINATDHTVAIEVVFGTDVTTLSPTLTLSEGATSDPASGVAVDFTSPVTYTVTAEDGTTIQDWTVTVTLDSELPDTDILTFSLSEQTSAAVINATDHTVAIEVVFGTDVTTLSPILTLSEGATSDPASGAAVDFTNSVTYAVTAEDGTTIQDWIVTVTVGGEAANNETDMLTFVLAEQTGAAVINSAAHTVAIEVAFGTDVTALAPTLTLSKGATSDPASGVAVDFTNPVTYVVTAEDGTTVQAWVVAVTEEDEPLGVGHSLHVDIYPNPVIDILHVKTPTEIQVRLTDLNGRMIHYEETGSDLKLDISHLGSGVYLLIIRQGDRLATHKIIKRD